MPQPPVDCGSTRPRSGAGAWTRVLYPVPDPIVGGVPRPDLQSAYANICNDVAIEPGSGDERVLVNCAWRDGAAYNGFYYSQDGGQTFARVNPTGALNPQDVGRTTFAYADNGAMLYALVESMTHYTHSSQTALGGVFVSRSGSPAGPWNKVASPGQLASKGSALKNAVFYRPGIQAWYNQFIDVDPDDPNHVFVGLEEVYETGDGGAHWSAIGAYWNFDFRCWSSDPARNSCPMTTHPDQHSIAIGGGSVYVGNDGGLYRRPLRGQVNANGNATDWAEPQRQHPDAAVLLRRSGHGPWWRRGVRRTPGQRRLAAASRGSGRQRNDGIAVRRRRRRHASSIRRTAARSFRSTCSWQWS